MQETKVQKAVKYAILSMLGRDGVGIVSAYTSMLLRHNCDIVHQNSQVSPCGFFSEFVLFRYRGTALDAIRQEAKRRFAGYDPRVIGVPRPQDLKQDDMEANVNAGGSAKGYLKYQMQVTALDTPGVVSKVTDVASHLNVNFSAINGLAYRPHGNGQRMYRGNFRLQIPNPAAVRELRRKLVELERQNHWEIDLWPDGSSGRRMEVVVLDAPQSSPVGELHFSGSN